MDPSGMMTGMAWWPVGMLVCFGMMAAFVWLFVRIFAVGSRPALAVTGPAAPPSALEIVRERYARGEIDITTFERLTTELMHSSTPDSKI